MRLFSDNPDFYPTPSEVIEKMLMNEDIIDKRVLEPSAGSGNIVRYLQRNGAKDVIACENDRHNQKLLNGICNIIAEDFLTVTSDMISHVDYIVMNPPFSKGAQHIMHAFEIAPAGCTVVALCNTSSLDGSHYYQRNRELNEIVNLHGKSEYLGRVFERSERNTHVEVSLIKLYKPNTGDNEFDGYFLSDDEHEDDIRGSEGLIKYNVVRELVNRYVTAVKMFDKVMEISDQINDTAKFVDYEVADDGNERERQYGYLPITFGARWCNDKQRYSKVTHDIYKKELQKYYWHIIFQKLNMEKYATQKLREQINKFIEESEHTPFTMSNIYRVINIVIQTNGQRMQSAMIEAFDMICSYSAENSTAGETWRTNANYMVNRKFIVPSITDVSWGGGFSLTWDSSRLNKIEDICKVLCTLTGRDYNEIGRLYTLVCNNKTLEWGKWFEWGFFRCKGFKKGTMHFEFLDEDVWFKFNYECSKYKGWNLPKKTKR